jgi:hypothetical protein
LANSRRKRCTSSLSASFSAKRASMLLVMGRVLRPAEGH